MPRAGTTWLYRNLSQHPNCKLPKLKEINFFSINFNRGIQWYNSLYKGETDQQVRFDISPFYFLEPGLVDNIRQQGLNPKIILILREPNEWIRSMYYQIKSYTPNMPQFSNFINEHIINFDNKSRTIHLSKINVLKRVNNLISSFKGNIFLANFKMIKNDPIKLLNEIERFSNLPLYFNPTNVITTPINASDSKFSILAYLSTKRYLRSIANTLPFDDLINFIKRKLYKENRSNLHGITKEKNALNKDKYNLLTNETYIDELFPPVFESEFFKQHNIVML